MKRLAIVVCLTVLMFAAAHAGSVNEARLVSSAKKVAGVWEKLFSGRVEMVLRTTMGGYMGMVYKGVKGTVNYNIRRTDSIVSPYLLIISFNSFNFGMPDGVEDSPEKILNSLRSITIRGYQKISDPIKVFYALQDGVWVLKDGRILYDITGERSPIFLKENRRYFGKLFKIPVK